MHDHVKDFAAVQNKLDSIKIQIEELYNKAQKHADNVHFTVISDHGMTPLAGTVDIMQAMENSRLVFGQDYGACFDSTMARFYYLNKNAESVISEIMKDFPGHFLSTDEEIKYGIYREDRMFGDAVFLLDAGLQIVPSDMGSRPLNGMHGFAPEDEDSFAVILSNTDLPENVNSVVDYFNFMIERAKNL